MAWLLLATMGWTLIAGEGGDATWLVAVVFALALLFRVLTFAEYATADATALRWRSLAASHHHPWHEVQLVELDAKWLYAGRGGGRTPMPCIRVHLRNGRSFWMLASLGCSVTDIGEFIAAARLLSPYEWSVPGDLLVHSPAGRRQPSGSRVGQPTTKAQQRRRGRR
ncbi:MAG TPA: hypothetical protein DCR14_17640 [Acidimicrobiaceae bacterium]|nr:hypothetical protein [Acidimicrobiaceae bacterium]